MDLSRIPLFEALTRRMSWLHERQTVLAENVANADTPGYVASDLREPDFRSLLGQEAQRVTLATTQPGHIAASDAAGDFSKFKPVTERTLNGNGVALEEEMMKVSQTASDYSLITTLYRSNLGLIKSVIGKGS